MALVQDVNFWTGTGTEPPHTPGTEFSRADKKVLRDLGERIAEIAGLSVHEGTVAKWKALNGLQPVKPMIWVQEPPWSEMDVDDELRLRTTSDWARYYEWEMRVLLYTWRHMPADMVVEPVLYSPLVVYNTGFGIAEHVDIAPAHGPAPTAEPRSAAVERAWQSSTDEIISRHYNVQIRDEEDLERIEVPTVSYDGAVTDQQYEQFREIMSGVIEVKKRGANVPVFWIAPWDLLTTWWGVQEVLVDMVDRPELVHKAVDKLMNAHLGVLDQLEAQNLLSLNNTYGRVGSGGLGYTDELPQPGYDPAHVRAKDLWGSSTAQICGSVSPRMHEEFALHYELRWLSRFGLNYYGCCEPLHRKMALLEKIPNLRKVSMSAFIDVDEAVANMGNRYVFSYKPSPAVLAEDNWDLARARDDLEAVFVKAKAHGCVVEVIMKDISTLRHQPQRLWEWAKMATDLSERYSS
ncbi:MAG TPA: hypothetical protein VME20_11885 [Acidimicrobiales bacterium]|nr:hypothetical protein [Acidimicrobiales bacterium]